MAGGVPRLLKLLNTRETWTPRSVSDRKVYDAAVREVGGQWECRRTLKAHCGCVNAVAFSNSGSLMATGGDDKKILLWPVDEFRSTIQPIGKYHGHVSNIFSVSFDSTDRKFFSCGNDGLLLHYDVEYSAVPITSALKGPSKTAIDVVLAHEEAALKLSICPGNDSLVLTASQDSTVKLFDTRCADQLQGQIKTPGIRQNSVNFNPVADRLFLTSDDKGGVLLHDLRLVKRHWKEPSSATPSPVRKFTTQLRRGSATARPADIPSAVWSHDGRYIGAIIHRWYPTLYTPSSPDPVCVLKTTSDGAHGFKSVATVKTGAFGGMDDVYFLSGSDDFRAYGWRLPSAVEMERGAKTGAEVEGGNEVVYVSGEKQVKPMEINEACFVLKGHRSIVNSVVHHPTRPMVATAGVEKTIRMFSPFPFEANGDQKTCERARSTSHLNPLLTLQMMLHDEEDESIEEDLRTLTFFDLLLAEDEARDTLWGPATDQDSSDDESEGESEIFWNRFTMETDTSTDGIWMANSSGASMNDAGEQHELPEDSDDALETLAQMGDQRYCKRDYRSSRS
ncbi:uncharacterized protein SPPG_03879 [Spizellomyces punctatus DAOM BR117]|uniref:Uncharacterized protein n=1 Tax=Spizellomyces punctatus (strain DAOM BR117) TaxID=645134 RepID=A0A0L0HH23_SPIPD|nr:uncharacterized protein SPPG_03879 [Spizellomyces punctatus DAOM BR117]KND00766.1 hypothetical protein SPPG_03879 [Spizellomyces punctatus DAOM BR117]|eukprot:XP_016608805.1 hypothetical protein SPPG_03879 [Spizellomyces punctatus DAOM BR117]